MENKRLDNIVEEENPGLLKRTLSWIKKYPDTTIQCSIGTAILGLGIPGIYELTKDVYNAYITQDPVINLKESIDRSVISLFCVYVGMMVNCLGLWAKEIEDDGVGRQEELERWREKNIKPLQEEFDRLVNEMHERHKSFFNY